MVLHARGLLQGLGCTGGKDILAISFLNPDVHGFFSQQELTATLRSAWKVVCLAEVKR